MRKKSQITLPIIAGLLLLILIGSWIYFANIGFKISFESKGAIPEFSSQVLADAMDTCILDYVLKSIGSFGMCSTEDKIRVTLMSNLSKCLNLRQLEEEGFTVVKDDGPSVIEVNINENNVFVKVEYPIEILKQDTIIKFQGKEFSLGLDKSISISLSKEYRTLKDYVLVSPDSKVELHIPKNTKITSKSGPVSKIALRVEKICPHDPSVLGEVKYLFTPDIIEFSPEAYLTVRYVNEDVSRHAREDKFKLAYLDNNHWEQKISSSDIEENKVTGPISHLSDWVASCDGTNKQGLQSFFHGIIDDYESKIIARDLSCVHDFAGPCGYSRLITYINPQGKSDYLKFYTIVFNETYKNELNPLMTTKEIAASVPFWWHPGSCDGVPGYCADQWYKGLPQCIGYSLNCLYGEDEDGKNRPQYDYSESRQKIIELLNAVHSDKPHWPLYVEVWNEPNLQGEWHDISMTDYEITQYAKYVVEMSKAIKSLPHSESVKVVLAGLAPTEGAYLCDLKPSKKKEIHRQYGEIDDKDMPNYFNSDYCEMLANAYSSGTINYCTGSFPGYDESGLTEDWQRCAKRSQFADTMNGIRNFYIDRGLNVFPDVPAAPRCICTGGECNGANWLGPFVNFAESLEKANAIKKRIQDTFGTYCYEEKTAVATNEYLTKLFASEYGDELCGAIDLLGDHPYPDPNNMAFPGGNDPMGALAYQGRLNLVKSYCPKLAIECIEPADSDHDGDGVIDIKDNCPSISNKEQEDWEGDGIGDLCDDSDNDNDGLADSEDICPMNPEIQTFDDITESEKEDSDSDGWADVCDNCPDLANDEQKDSNHDGVGDACDADTDSDGILNDKDNCMYIGNKDQKDTDHDGIGDLCDNCPDLQNTGQEDWNSNKKGDLCEDSDNDGFLDNIDYCPETPSIQNTKADCEPKILCPGKVFITETGWSWPSQGKYIENYAEEMKKAFDFWVADDNVLAITPFHLGDQDVYMGEWEKYSWTEKICEDSCVGKSVFNLVGKIENPVSECNLSQDESSSPVLVQTTSADMCKIGINFAEWVAWLGNFPKDAGDLGYKYAMAITTGGNHQHSTFETTLQAMDDICKNNMIPVLRSCVKDSECSFTSGKEQAQYLNKVTEDMQCDSIYVVCGHNEPESEFAQGMAAEGAWAKECIENVNKRSGRVKVTTPIFNPTWNGGGQNVVNNLNEFMQGFDSDISKFDCLAINTYTLDGEKAAIDYYNEITSYQAFANMDVCVMETGYVYGGKGPNGENGGTSDPGIVRQAIEPLLKKDNLAFLLGFNWMGSSGQDGVSWGSFMLSDKGESLLEDCNVE